MTTPVPSPCCPCPPPGRAAGLLLCDTAPNGTTTQFVRIFLDDGTHEDQTLDGAAYTPSPGGTVGQCTGDQLDGCDTTTPVAAASLCLADGTPVVVVVQRDCDGTVSAPGWVNLLTGTYTAGPVPAGAGTCEQVAAAECDTTTAVATTGVCLADGTPVAVVTTRACDGTITSPGWVNLLTGEFTAGALPAGAGACDQVAAAECDTTTPITTTGLCLADGTPIATVAQRDCDGVVTQAGWLNLTSGAYTTGLPPAGTVACGAGQSIQVSGVFCDVDPGTGEVYALVLVEYTYDEAGAIESTRIVLASDGSTYALQGELSICPGAGTAMDVETEVLCLLDADGTLIQLVVAEFGYTTTTGDRLFVRFTDPTTGAVIAPPAGAVVGVCPPAADPCDQFAGTVCYQGSEVADPTGTPERFNLNDPTFPGCWVSTGADPAYQYNDPVTSWEATYRTNTGSASNVDFLAPEIGGGIQWPNLTPPMPVLPNPPAGPPYTGTVVQNGITITVEITGNAAVHGNTFLRLGELEHVKISFSEPVTLRVQTQGFGDPVDPHFERFCDVVAVGEVVGTGEVRHGFVVRDCATGETTVHDAETGTAVAAPMLVECSAGCQHAETVELCDSTPTAVDLTVRNTNPAPYFNMAGSRQALTSADAVAIWSGGTGTVPSSLVIGMHTFAAAVVELPDLCGDPDTLTIAGTLHATNVGPTAAEAVYGRFSLWNGGAQIAGGVLSGGLAVGGQVTATIPPTAVPVADVAAGNVVVEFNLESNGESNTVKAWTVDRFALTAEVAAPGCGSPFFRTITRGCDGTVLSIVDTSDGETVYAPVGDAAPCQSAGRSTPCLHCTERVLCDDGGLHITNTVTGTVATSTLPNGITWRAQGSAANWAATLSNTDGSWWSTGVFPNPAITPGRYTFSHPVDLSFTVVMLYNGLGGTQNQFQVPIGAEPVSLPPGYQYNAATGILTALPGLTDCTTLTNPTRAGGARFLLRSVSAATLQFLGARVASCGVFDTYRMGAFDVTPAAGKFVRTTCRDCAGAIVSTADTALDGTTAYTPRGLVGECPDTLACETLTVCDRLPGGATVTFRRTICRNADGGVVSTTDTRMDGTTAYAVAGEVVDCDAACSDCETIELCDVFALNGDTGFYPVPSGAGNCFAGPGGPGPCTLPNGIVVDPGVGFVPLTPDHPDWLVKVTPNTPVTVNVPSKLRFRWTVDAGQGVQMPTGTVPVDLHPLHTWDAATHTLLGAAGASNDALDQWSTLLLPYAQGAVSFVYNPAGGASATSATMSEIEAAPADPVPFLRRICRRCDGTVESVTDTLPDAVTPYVVRGTVGSCSQPQGDCCQPVQVCITPTHPESLHFVTNEANETGGQLDPVWTWSLENDQVTWWPMYHSVPNASWTLTDTATTRQAHWVAPHPNNDTNTTGAPGEGPSIEPVPINWIARASFDLPPEALPDTIRIASTVIGADQRIDAYRLNDGPWHPTGTGTTPVGNYQPPAYVFDATDLAGSQPGTNELFLRITETVDGPSAGLMAHLIATYQIPDPQLSWTRMVCCDGRVYYLDETGARVEELPEFWQVAPCGATAADGAGPEPVSTGLRRLTGDTPPQDLVAEFPGLQSVTLTVITGTVNVTMTSGAAQQVPAGMALTWSVADADDTALTAAVFDGTPGSDYLINWTTKATSEG